VLKPAKLDIISGVGGGEDASDESKLFESKFKLFE
jgi:hypothetical protein